MFFESPAKLIAFFRSRANGAASQGVLTLIDQGVVSLTGFVGTLIIGRVSQEELGTYSLGLSTFWMIAGGVNALVWMPYTAKAAGMRRGARRRFRASNSAAALLGGLMLLIGFVIAGVIGSAVGGGWFPSFCFAMAPLALMLTAREHFRRVCVADFRGWRLLAFDLPVCLLSVSTMLLLAKQGVLTTEVAFLVTASAFSLALPLVASDLFRGRITLARLRVDFRSNWGFGKWLLLAALAALLSDASLRWLLSVVHGRGAMGEFGAVAAFVLLFNPLILAMSSFMRSLSARVYNADGHAGLLSHTARAVAIATVIGVAGVYLLSATCEWAMTHLFGQQYANRLLVQLMAIQMCLFALNIPVEAALTAMQLGKRISLVGGLRLAVVLVVGTPAVYLLGTIGIPIALVAANCLLLGLSWAMLLWAAPSGELRPLVTPARA